MSFRIVIPSRDIGNLGPCLEAIWRNELTIEREHVIVIDDGLYGRPPGPTYIQGKRPFIFSRAINTGLNACGDASALILNDDALLETPGGFSGLAAMAAQHPELGIIASTCNNVGNPNQHRISGGGIYGMGIRGGMCGPREDARMVCFVAVYIPRSTIDRVGLLDEDLTGYGFDDDLYCAAIRRAGLKIGIWDGCYVDHASLKSSYRYEDPEENYRRFQFNAKIYEQKLIDMGMSETERMLRQA